ncbi:MAG: hypothetical protein JW946_05675 [Candidatus Omnitrophica bacterium]|nr:hypothetical protein [Candidatus Omnitrophota bacterium]
MGKMLSVVGGAIAIIIGVILLIAWNEAFVLGLQFTVMAILIFGGLIALIAGLSEIKDSMAAKSEEKEEKK